jgi:hypothetical protein
MSDMQTNAERAKSASSNVSFRSQAPGANAAAAVPCGGNDRRSDARRRQAVRYRQEDADEPWAQDGSKQ